MTKKKGAHLLKAFLVGKREEREEKRGHTEEHRGNKGNKGNGGEKTGEVASGSYNRIHTPTNTLHPYRIL